MTGPVLEPERVTTLGAPSPRGPRARRVSNPAHTHFPPLASINAPTLLRTAPSSGRRAAPISWSLHNANVNIDLAYTTFGGVRLVFGIDDVLSARQVLALTATGCHDNRRSAEPGPSLEALWHSTRCRQHRVKTVFVSKDVRAVDVCFGWGTWPSGREKMWARRWRPSSGASRGASTEPAEVWR